MKITGGKYKSIAIFVVKDRRVRYTTSKVRLAIFSILGEKVKAANVLELFCGSGVLSIEAISRGANKAVLVDVSKEAIITVKRNMEKIGFSDYKALKMDYRRALRYLRNKGKFDIIFGDPPYDLGYGEEILVTIEKNSELLKHNSRILLELSTKEKLFIPNLFTIEVDKNFGETRIVLLKFGKEH